MTDTTWPYPFPESDVPEGMSPQQHELNLAQAAIDAGPAHLVHGPETPIHVIHPAWTIDGEPIETPDAWHVFNDAGKRPELVIDGLGPHLIDALVHDGDGNLVAAHLSTITEPTS